MLTPGLVSAQALAESEVRAEKVPDAVIASAVEAVAQLGKSVVQGRYQEALDRMNPKEKKRLIRQLGGLEKLEKQLATVPQEMAKNGVKVVFSKPKGKPQGFAVSPVFVKPAEQGGGGEAKGRWYYSQWLVLVPTVTRYEVRLKRDKQPDQLIKIENLSYQVAISDRDKEDWTFINGAGLTVNRLRNYYSTLPADIELPLVEERQVEN